MYVFIKVAPSQVGNKVGSVSVARFKSGRVASSSAQHHPFFCASELASRWVMKAARSRRWFTVYMFNDNRTSDIHPFSSFELGAGGCEDRLGGGGGGGSMK